VPLPLHQLDGAGSLLSIMQMPAGVPVATVGIVAARDAGLLAARVLAVTDADLAGRLHQLVADLAATASGLDAELKTGPAVDPELLTGRPTLTTGTIDRPAVASPAAGIP
jgi:5-(carboxyamino)imidazole ribonucleotide mutase